MPTPADPGGDGRDELIVATDNVVERYRGRLHDFTAVLLSNPGATNFETKPRPRSAR